MPRHSETRHVPYTAEQMFDLVADVGRYEEFLPWVIATRIRSNSETAMVADLVVGFKSLRETFTSKVNKERPCRIAVDYLDGPLKYLHNEWGFEPSNSGGCTIEFCVDFAFRSRVFESLAGQVFDRALRKMTDSFEARADALYGDGGRAVSGSSSSSAHSAA
ncbi:type II toxin-antitoxin system RatA family toxin [Parasphingopyxis algicola]|uniref:type II toxin-antitoxin system RatA family toxin n=1 Tax=Parasphingopyxis algicola TaxID=2026624 RepID=UPI0015A3E7DA|nr:type II toxin-antitoxin system RatA family toxin [Parasphingopyxis algicola]QLC24176.1 type II toxin-antitoxin system RatA family toxin [Parasphingopyxis algicola]